MCETLILKHWKSFQPVTKNITKPFQNKYKSFRAGRRAAWKEILWIATFLIKVNLFSWENISQEHMADNFAKE